jgi:hypothetical protein
MLISIIMKMIKYTNDNLPIEQKKRHKEFIDKLKPVYKKMGAEHLLKESNIDQVFKVSEEITDLNLNWFDGYFTNPILKPFHSKDRWQLLHLVIQASATHKVVYQQELALKIGVSVKTVYNIINELKDSGHFIVLNPSYLDSKDIDKRVVNVRPSVDLAIAYLDVNVEHILRCMNFLKAHTKISFSFN